MVALGDHLLFQEKWLGQKSLNSIQQKGCGERCCRSGRPLAFPGKHGGPENLEFLCVFLLFLAFPCVSLRFLSFLSGLSMCGCGWVCAVGSLLLCMGRCSSACCVRNGSLAYLWFKAVGAGASRGRHGKARERQVWVAMGARRARWVASLKAGCKGSHGHDWKPRHRNSIGTQEEAGGSKSMHRAAGEGRGRHGTHVRGARYVRGARWGASFTVPQHPRR